MFAEPDFRDPWEESPFINGNFVHHPHHRHHNNFHHHQHHPLVGSTGTCSAEAQHHNHNQQQHFIPIQVMSENYNNNNNNNNRLNKHSFPLMEEEMQEPEFEIKEINRIEIPTIFRQADNELSSRPPTTAPTTVRSTPHPVPPPTTMSGHHHHNSNSSPPNSNNFMDNNNHMSTTSPLNSPGYNSSIRHIPIFFEGKPKHQSNQNNNNNNSSSTQQQQQQQPVVPIPIPLPPAPRELEVNQIQKSGPPTPPPRNPHNIHHHAHPNIYSTPSTSSSSSASSTAAAAEEVKAPQRKNPASSSSSSSPPLSSHVDNDSPVPPPIKRPTPPKSPLEKVQLISEDVRQLEKQVNEFCGLSKTKEYLFLDEMLTRNLIRLDDINVEGREDIRMARKDCINLIQKCISSLENKISSNYQTNKNTNSSNDSNAMAVAVIAPAPMVLSPISSQVVKQNSGNVGNLAVPVMMLPTHRSEISIEVNLGEEGEQAKNSKVDSSKKQDSGSTS